MQESILNLILVTVLMLGSPGPALIALAASGAHFGFRKSMPFLSGILVGIGLVITATVAGLALLLEQNSSVKVSLQIFGSIYILYIAYKIVFKPLLTTSSGTEDVPRFFEGLILNCVNPKAYAAFIAIFSQFLLPTENTQNSWTLTAIIVFVVVAVLDICWLYFGQLIKIIWHHPKYGQLIRVLMAISMLLAVFSSLLL